MRLNIPLCLSFLGALVSFSSVSARATYSRQLQLAERDAELMSMRDAGLLDLRDDDFLDLRDEDLDMRDEGLLDIRDVEDLYEMLVRRAPKKTAAQTATRKAAAATAANKNGKAPTASAAKPKGAKAVSRPKTASQAAADQRKANKKQTSGSKYTVAAAAHKATTNLPGTHQKFQVKGGPSFTGKEVKKAVFNSHMEREANKNKSNTKLKQSPLKNFGNSDHRQKQPNKPNDVKSINHMKGTGHEFPIGSTTNKGPARVITQQTANGHTKFKGVVAHDVSRAPGSKGYNDHFQVKPSGSKRK